MIIAIGRKLTMLERLENWLFATHKQAVKDGRFKLAGVTGWLSTQLFYRHYPELRRKDQETMKRLRGGA